MMANISLDTHAFSASLLRHTRHCSLHTAFRRNTCQQSCRLRVQSAAKSEQTEKKGTRQRRKPKESSAASASSPNGRRKPKMSEGEEGASGKRPAESETEASGKQQSFGESALPEDAPSADERSQEGTEHSFEGWTPDEHLQAILEQHSAEEILEELKKMEQEGILPEETEEGVPMQFVARPGCTPFEYVNFTDETIEHDIDILVEAPIDKVYKIWSNRLNYSEWFDLIGQMVLHTEEPDMASYFLFYKWGKLPTLELYTTMRRSMEESKFVMEQSVDGMNLAIGAYFSEKEGGTEVNLRVAYSLPENLSSYVGPVGVWGDVNDILQENLICMRVFVEAADLDKLDQARQDTQAEMDQNLADTNKTLDTMRDELRKEGVNPEEGSPEARAEMLNILEELGFDAEASVTGSDEPSWWQREQARREEAASSSAAASAEAAVQQRQDQRQMQAEAEAEGKERALKKGNSTHPDHGNLPQILTKEFLEEKMHDYTQKELGEMVGVGSATISRYVKIHNLKWPAKRKGHKGPPVRSERTPGPESGQDAATSDPAQGGQGET